MIRKFLDSMRLIRAAPASIPFRWALLGRRGRTLKIVAVLFVVLEIFALLFLSEDNGNWDDGMEYMAFTLGAHAVALPVLLIAGIVVFSPVVTRAQREDLWLTGLAPRETVVGLLLPPLLACFVVMVIVPMLFLQIGVFLFFEDLCQLMLDLADGSFFARRRSQWMGLFGLLYSVMWAVWWIGLYVGVGLTLIRVLLHAVIRHGRISIFTVLVALLHGAWVAFVTTIMTFAFFVLIASGPDSSSAGVPQAFALLGFMVVQLIAMGMASFASLTQFTTRRFFAMAVSSPADAWDWLAVEGWNLAPVLAKTGRLLPRLLFATAVGVGAASVLFAFSFYRNSFLHSPHTPDHDTYILGATLLGHLVMGLLAFRSHGWFAWRHPSAGLPGSMRVSLLLPSLFVALLGQAGMLVFLTELGGGSGFDTFTQWLIVVVITMVPGWMLLATLTGLCQMPRTSKWTTLAVVFVIGVLAVALYYPGTAWSHLLMQLSFLPAVGAVAYFIHGGGAHLCQMLFDRERAVMADGDRNPAVIPVHVESPS
jgi:hypothetical protein